MIHVYLGLIVGVVSYIIIAEVMMKRDNQKAREEEEALIQEKETLDIKKKSAKQAVINNKIKEKLND